MPFKYPLGLKAKDRVSGFVGVITVRSEALTGCSRYWLDPVVDKDGKLKDGHWIDEHVLEVLSTKPVVEPFVPAGPGAG